jgi:hypothetical protein
MAWQGNGMGVAWARHAMCELAFSVSAVLAQSVNLHTMLQAVWEPRAFCDKYFDHNKLFVNMKFKYIKSNLITGDIKRENKLGFIVTCTTVI